MNEKLCYNLTSVLLPFSKHEELPPDRYDFKGILSLLPLGFPPIYP